MNKFTVNEATLEQHMKAKMNPNDWNAVERIYIAGMKLLFSPQTHQQMLEEFMKGLQEAQGQPVGNVIGADMAHVMMILYAESKGTMPGIAIIPAATLLIAKVCEYLNNTKMLPMTDKAFSDAVHIMAVALHHNMDPTFANRLAARQPTQSAAPAGQPSGMMAQGV